MEKFPELTRSNILDQIGIRVVKYAKEPRYEIDANVFNVDLRFRMIGNDPLDEQDSVGKYMGPLDTFLQYMTVANDVDKEEFATRIADAIYEEIMKTL